LPPHGKKGGTVTDEEKWEKMYQRISACAKMYALQKKIFGWAGDIASEAWLIARERGYFDIRMLSEAARRLGIFDSRDCVDHIEYVFTRENEDEKITTAEREALRVVLSYASQKTQHACSRVLSGENFQEAAENVGMSASTLSRELAHLGEKQTSKKRNTKLKNFPLFDSGEGEAGRAEVTV